MVLGSKWDATSVGGQFSQKPESKHLGGRSYLACEESRKAESKLLGGCCVESFLCCTPRRELFEFHSLSYRTSLRDRFTKHAAAGIVR